MGIRGLRRVVYVTSGLIGMPASCHSFQKLVSHKLQPPSLPSHANVGNLYNFLFLWHSELHWSAGHSLRGKPEAFLKVGSDPRLELTALMSYTHQFKSKNKRDSEKISWCYKYYVLTKISMEFYGVQSNRSIF